MGINTQSKNNRINEKRKRINKEGSCAQRYKMNRVIDQIMINSGIETSTEGR